MLLVFQSHAGSIEAWKKRPPWVDKKKCFNPTLVRLRHANLSGERNRYVDVSIPRWFD